MLLNSDVDHNTDSKINLNSYDYDENNRYFGLPTYVVALV